MFRRRFVHHHNRAIIAAIATIMLYSAAYATPKFEPVFNPALETVKATETIKIDGRIDDAGWRSAGRAANFVERSPGENTQPSVKTEAYITYDEDNLYVAFVCNDNPANIRATMCQRDQFYGDDAVGLLIDTYGEATWAYQFFVNPYGIQKDRMWTNVHGEDPGFDLIWHSAAEITETGFTVEMAIPFASMRFPNKDVQSWKVDFWRIHPRESYSQYSWSANDRNEQCWPCQWGTVDGIAGVQPGKGLEILGSLISNQTGAMSSFEVEPDADGNPVALADTDPAQSPFDNGGILGDVSMGAKYSVSSAVTLEATVNPDFSQIEADAGQIDVNTTIALFYPERRPFFQEGSDLFRTMFNSFYTRMVNDPQLAAKGTARWDKTSLAYMMARDENSPYIIPTEGGSYDATPGKSTVNAIRGLRSIGNNSQVGFMATDRRYDGGGSGTILSGDANIRLSRKFSWVGQFVYGHTEEPDGIEIDSGVTFDHGKYTVDLDGESYSGTALVTELRMRSRNLMFTVDYNQLTPTYRTQTGYDPWNDQKNLFAWARYNFRFDNGLFEMITPNFFADRRWNWDNRRKWAHFNAGIDSRLRWAQTYVGLGYQTGSELWRDVEFQDLWSFNVNLNSRPTDWLGYNASFSVGQGPALRTLDKGDELSVSAGLDLKPIDRLIIEPSVRYARSKDANTGDLLFKQTIARARFRFQVDPRLSIRLVVQRNSSEEPLYKDFAQMGYFPEYHMYFGEGWDIDPLITYRLNSFSVFYLGSSHDYHDFNAAFPTSPSSSRLTGRQFFMKIQYLFQT